MNKLISIMVSIYTHKYAKVQNMNYKHDKKSLRSCYKQTKSKQSYLDKIVVGSMVKCNGIFKEIETS